MHLPRFLLQPFINASGRRPFYTFSFSLVSLGWRPAPTRAGNLVRAHPLLWTGNENAHPSCPFRACRSCMAVDERLSFCWGARFVLACLPSSLV